MQLRIVRGATEKGAAGTAAAKCAGRSFFWGDWKEEKWKEKKKRRKEKKGENHRSPSSTSSLSTSSSSTSASIASSRSNPFCVVEAS